MIDTLLIANRGEIACRIVQTCRRMGIRTVAVHSEADAGALHVRMADTAVPIGGNAPEQSYLRGERIVEAALATGARAIHPGYGFLSENPDFVEAVEAAGLIFVGPSARAIRAMGLKDAAKALMERAGVPVVPGYHGADQADVRLAQEAARIGWPVLVKAVAGGGGKGMRLVEREADFADALASARGEARGAFGNDAVLVEKFVQKPRHIEVQVFGDGERAVHLFERDCSLQRRHQKVIEEAPAPGMTAQLREAMGAAAVRAAEAIGYAGAGTVEFIVDASRGLRPDGFWFMEMNTRLQVEHPVTEEITGLDLVEWQIRVAAGERLPEGFRPARIDGHAFEARLYAEDVEAGFLPATGRLDHLAFPAGARIESGVVAGDAISPHYDPMIAKIVVHGPDRRTALRRLSDALARTQVAGTVTNLAFLKALATHEGFAAGDVDTGLIDREVGALTADPGPSPQVRAQGALIAAGLWEAEDPLTGFALWAPLRREIMLEPEPAVLSVHAPDRVTVELPEAVVEARRDRHGWRFDGRAAVPFVRHGERITLFDGVGRELRVVDQLTRKGGGEAGAGDVQAPMPGLIRAVFVAEGDTVEAGDRLLTLEAMKMEHVLRAPRAGVIAALGAVEGSQVEAGDVLVALEDAG